MPLALGPLRQTSKGQSVACTDPQETLRRSRRAQTSMGIGNVKEGGWLSAHPELNLGDFDIQDVTEPEPVKYALKSIKSTIEGMLDKFGTKDYYGYVGGDTNFRKDICTLQPYKGQRTAELPVHLAACKEYVMQHHRATMSKYVEADDLVSTDNYNAVKNKQDFAAVVLDKDFKGCEGNWYFYLNDDRRRSRGFGKLWRNGSDVDGVGRMFKYLQICHGDKSDSYEPHCFSDKENGPVTTYNALKDCKNDTEAFLAMKDALCTSILNPKSSQTLEETPLRLIGFM